MRCSVIILNWNGEQWLEKFLPDVVKYSISSDCEVVVADNGSTDGSIELMNTFPFVRLIKFDKNYGFAEGYNRALAQTKAEYTVLLNSDVQVTEGWLNPLLDYMDTHPNTAAIQPKILSYKNKKLFEHAGAAGGHIDMFGYPFCRGRILNFVEEDNGQYNDITECFWASGACMCVRTNIYKECGGLDNGFFAHMEEIDLCWRMQCRGYKIACVPDSVIFHVGGGALDYENPRKTYLNFRNNLLMLYKNLPSRKLPWVMLVRFFLDYTAMFQALLTGKQLNAKAIARARHDFNNLKKLYNPIRKENIALSKIPYPATISHRSIIFDFYIRHKRQ